MITLVAKCEKCGGRGELYWGFSHRLNSHWWVPCPQCRPEAEQKHPDRETLRFDDET